jgi:uncharacterized protein YndB with AHSA1/START domain
MLKKIVAVVITLVVALLAIVALQPSEFSISRTASIAAPPAEVFAQVNDLHHWEAWSPWAKLDPAMKQSYEGPPAGTGAISSWAGNKEVGEGRMTIVDSRTNELVRIKLEFLEPFEGTSDTEFTFKPEGDQTSVTWRMSGKNNFMAKAAHLFMNMEKMIGGNFEKGLAQLKSVVESAPKQ